MLDKAQNEIEDGWAEISVKRPRLSCRPLPQFGCHGRLHRLVAWPAGKAKPKGLSNAVPAQKWCSSSNIQGHDDGAYAILGGHLSTASDSMKPNVRVIWGYSANMESTRVLSSYESQTSRATRRAD